MDLFEMAKIHGDWTEVFKIVEAELSENDNAILVHEEISSCSDN